MKKTPLLTIKDKRPDMYVEIIAAKFQTAASDSCKEHGSCMSMRGIKNHIILRGERLERSQKMADCLAFGEISRLYVAVCELKSTRPDPSVVEAQLNMGVEHAIRICNDINVNFQPQIFPILVASGYSGSALVRLRSITVKIYGKQTPIILKKRTCKFLDVISKYAHDLR